MDAKGDDSGSDTLDQSLQKKCVVADDDSSSKQPDAAVSEDNAAEEPTTEPGGNMSDPKDSPASPSPPPPPPPAQQSSSTDNSASDAVLVAANKDLPTDESTTSSSGSKDDSRGFESKVRQISADLKDTTLADENSLEKVDEQPVPAAACQEDKADDDGASTAADAAAAPSASAAATAVTLEDAKNDSDGYDSDRTITYESPSKKSSSCSSEKKKSKKITKKVRFKAKNKVKPPPRSDDEGDDNEPDGDEDDNDEEEEEEDDDTLNEGGRSKKIQISLSFVSPHDEDDGNLSDEASAQFPELPEIPKPEPEGGVQKILGKLSKMGKIEYLFRWVDKPGIQWETEEVLSNLCPTLIKVYEEQRAREREQDMYYAMRRKKIRRDRRNV